MSEPTEKDERRWRSQPCPICQGTGDNPPHSGNMCENCGGTGEIHVPDDTLGR